MGNIIKKFRKKSGQNKRNFDKKYIKEIRDQSWNDKRKNRKYL